MSLAMSYELSALRLAGTNENYINLITFPIQIRMLAISSRDK